MWFHNVLNHPNWPRNPLRPLRRCLVHDGMSLDDFDRIFQQLSFLAWVAIVIINRTRCFVHSTAQSATAQSEHQTVQRLLWRCEYHWKVWLREDRTLNLRTKYTKKNKNQWPTNNHNRPINPLSRHFAFRAGWVFLTDGWCCSRWCDGVASIAPRLKNGWGHLWSPTPPEDDDNEDWESTCIRIWRPVLLWKGRANRTTQKTNWIKGQPSFCQCICGQVCGRMPHLRFAPRISQTTGS